MRTRWWTITCLLWLSGALGLVYEVVWAKYLAFILGNAAYANAIVLAVFLSGLAMGNAILGRYADRIENQLYAYAWLELGIGLMGGLSAVILTGVGSAYVTFAAGSGLSGVLGLTIKIGMAAAVLLPPTLLMGGTLPLVTRHLTRSLGLLQSHLAWLYFLNSFGAVVGTLVAGFYLIPVLGLDASMGAAGLSNALIGVIALHLAKGEAPASKPETPVPVAMQEQPSEEASATVRRYVQIVVFGSGFIALAYEVAWIRLLAMILGSSTYAFTMMLAAFIAGISLGSVLVFWGWGIGKTTLARFAIAELGIAAGILITLPLYERLPFYFAQVSGNLSHSPESFAIYQCIQLFFCFVLMLIPTTFLGMTLPLAARLTTTSREEIGTKVGHIFSLNIAGNVLGVGLTTLWLLPALGLKGLIFFGIAINLALGLVGLWLVPGTMPGRRPWAFALIVALVGQVIISPSFDMRLIGSGAFRFLGKLGARTFDEWKAENTKRMVLFSRDDSNATVTVDGNPAQFTLKVNGKPDASTHGDLPTQILLGQLPMLFNPGAKDILAIGFGSGITAGSILLHPVERLDLVEISPAVIEAGKEFREHNHHVLENPRLHVVLDDAFNYLQLTPRQYDVIVSEPSNPWVAGVGNLFTLEAFQLMAKHLKPGGVSVQWFHTYEMDDDSLALILRTYQRVFPQVSMWESMSRDVIMIGSKEPVAMNGDQAVAAFNLPPIRKEFKRVGISQFTSVLSLETLTSRGVAAVGGEGVFNMLRFPQLEYRAPAAFFAGSTTLEPYRSDVRLHAGSDASTDLQLSRRLLARKAGLTSGEFADIHAYRERYLKQSARFNAHVVSAWRNAFPKDVHAIVASAKWLNEIGDVPGALAEISVATALAPKNLVVAELMAELEFKRLATAIGVLSPSMEVVKPALVSHERLLVLDPANRAATYTQLAAIYHAAGLRIKEFEVTEQALALLGQAPGEKTMSIQLLVSAAYTCREAGDDQKARSYLKRALALDPTDETARRLMGAMRTFPER